MLAFGCHSKLLWLTVCGTSHTPQWRGIFSVTPFKQQCIAWLTGQPKACLVFPWCCKRTGMPMYGIVMTYLFFIRLTGAFST